jgi:predicted Zn-dependent protease
MDRFLADRIFRRRTTRRDALWLVGAAGAAVGLPPLLSGCATDPVTGRSTLVGLSEQQEVQIDRQASPVQFSADYGAVQDPALNAYVDGVARDLGRNSHRPDMPYSARVVNAAHINAYTFPGGSMAATRGILLELESEDELAALLGHETGHVNARHAAERAGRQQLANAAVGAASIAAGLSEYGGAIAPVIGVAGQVGASALLASYSRDDEREADALGLEYGTRTGYSARGMVDLMDMLKSQGHGKPSLIETMFSSHPMSDERYATTVAAADSTYAASLGRPLKRERYLDQTARLRRQKPAIAEMQKAEALMSAKRLDEAHGHLARALQLAPDDYGANVAMGKLELVRRRPAEADAYLAKAIAVYPDEAQARYLAGVADLSQRRPEAALGHFEAYDRLLPGNPQTLFFRGVAYESMQNRRAAAENYVRFLQTGARNEQAQYAYRRLGEWGVVR